MVTAKYCYPENGYHPIDELDVGSEYNVSNIIMGQSHTDIYLENFTMPFNSVNFEFFENGCPIDIFKDDRFNLYIDLRENTDINVTKHATKRLRQRLGINKKSADKNAERALKYGTTKISVCKDKHAFMGTKICPVCGGPIADTYARVVGFYTPVLSMRIAEK